VKGDGLQIGRRQELYEKKHGKAKALGGQAAQGHKANANLADAFTKDATKKTRQSERDATRAKKVAVCPTSRAPRSTRAQRSHSSWRSA
jgi:hypothetical protein